MIGNPKEYQSPHLEDKPAPSYAELVNKFTELNSEAYSAAQGLKANLTRGMVAMLQQPVVQVVSVSPMTSELKKFEMYHLILSDGVHTQDATLESHLNYLVKDSHLRKGTIVRLLEFMYNTIQSPSMIIVIQLEVLQKESELIGSPKGHFTTVADYANPYSGQYSSGQGLKRPLTQGAVAAMLEGEMGVEQRPVMQVVDVSVMTHNGFSFYRLVLSDGVHKVNANLFPHLSHLVEENCLRKGTIVCLLKFMCDRVLDQNQSCRVIEIEQLEVLQTDCLMIGNPKQYRSVHLEDKHDRSYVESVTKFTKMDSGAYSAGQGLKAYLTRGMVAMLQQPVVQVVGVSPMRSELEKFEMYHLILSDGVHTQHATLAVHLNHLVKNSHLRKSTIVRLLEFMCNIIQSPSMIIVIQLEVLEKESELIGSPKAYQLRCEKPSKRAETYATRAAGYANPNSGPYPSGQGLKWHLTQGAVAAMLEGEMAVEQRPVMQVVDIQGMRHEGLSFYSLVLSDGVHQVKTDLFPHLSHVVTDNYLRRGAIVRILKFMCDTFISDILNQYQNCRFTVAVELEVLETESKLIGSPSFYQLRNKKKGLDSNHAAYALVNDPAHSAGGSHPNGQGIKGHLTRGAVVAMLEGKMTAEQQPVMQFVAVIPFRNEKFRHILLSDGVYKMSALLWSNLHLVDDNCIRSGTIVRILKFELHTLKNHKIIIVKELEVLQMECELIGRPMLYQLVNKQKDLVADHAAYVPAGNALQSNGYSHPRYKATPG